VVDVRIYSKVGHGTTVKLYLPRAIEEEDAIRPADQGPIIGGQETIVVAEDDDDVRETVVEMLSELGYRVLKTKDAVSALTVIESGVHVDLLFTDVVMPGELKSPELARRVRESYPATAVLFTSGYTANSIVHSGKLDPGVQLLTKPYTREALARKVRQVLGERRRQPSSAIEAPTVKVTLAAKSELTVLLVEDEALILIDSAEMLRALGHRVIEAASAEAAMQALETAESLDVLVTDFGLPGLSGANLALRARQRWPLLGVVFATGRSSDAVTDALPGAVVLNKPYGAEDMARAIAAALHDTTCEAT